MHHFILDNVCHVVDSSVPLVLKTKRKWQTLYHCSGVLAKRLSYLQEYRISGADMGILLGKPDSLGLGVDHLAAQLSCHALVHEICPGAAPTTSA